jgi:proteasome lid subunit RPN8/RPN11
MLSIGEADYQALRRHGEEAYPHESCGVLMGRTEGDERVVSRVARCANTRHDSPHNRYGIDPLEILRVERQGRERGEDIVGFYHSHPDHPARWSATDLAEAHWIGCSYVITSVGRGRAEATNSFLLVGDAGRLESRTFRDEEIRVTHGEAKHEDLHPDPLAAVHRQEGRGGRPGGDGG